MFRLRKDQRNSANDHELGNVERAPDMRAFYAEIDALRAAVTTYNANVERIDRLHLSALNTLDDGASKQLATERESLVEGTRVLSNDLKRRIQILEAKRLSATEDQHVAFVKQQFRTAVNNYHQMEQRYTARYRQQVERQFKIVNPSATPEEVRAVVDDQQGGKVFMQALMNSNRYEESRTIYREVHQRQEDIKKIERTTVELAQLINDLSVIVAKQDDDVNFIKQQAGDIDHNIASGVTHIDDATERAKRTRKLRKWAFFITIIILIAIGLIVWLALGHPGAH